MVISILCAVLTSTHCSIHGLKFDPNADSLLAICYSCPNVLKRYHRYFNYHPNRGCPFWDDASGKCASSTCAVEECKAEEIPKGLKGAKGDSTDHADPAHKYSASAQADLDVEAKKKKGEVNNGLDGAAADCDGADPQDIVDKTISMSAHQSLQEWEQYDDTVAK
jgi:hypothetical protein